MIKMKTCKIKTCITIAILFFFIGNISAQKGEGVDFYDEALRLFGTASSGESITENQALQGNRILYHKNGNLYPDENAVKYFSLDFETSVIAITKDDKEIILDLK
jgi:hypothetical protein